MKVTYMVVMESEAFGREEFPRDTLAEAQETVRNLRAKAKAARDGIDRDIHIEVCEDRGTTR